jgi:hypothetical protein
MGWVGRLAYQGAQVVQVSPGSLSHDTTENRPPRAAPPKTRAG